jgi:hypothetical protein
MSMMRSQHSSKVACKRSRLTSHKTTNGNTTTTPSTETEEKRQATKVRVQRIPLLQQVNYLAARNTLL